MSSVLLISGSPRKGNSEFILGKIQEYLTIDSEIILLRDKDIKYCEGCLYCHNKPECRLRDDDMNILYDKLVESNLIVVASPNYFDNITGLLKVFIDRLHPFYKNEQLRNKKLIQIMVGGGETEGKYGTQFFLDISLYGFVKYLYLDLIGSYSFRALHIRDLQETNDCQVHKTIKLIAEKINSFFLNEVIKT